MALLFRATLRPSLVAAARRQADRGLAGRMEGHADMDMAVTGGSLWSRIRSPEGVLSAWTAPGRVRHYPRGVSTGGTAVSCWGHHRKSSATPSVRRPEVLGVAESLVEQVTQLPWAATVRGLRAWQGVAELPARACYPAVRSLWVGC